MSRQDTIIQKEHNAVARNDVRGIIGQCWYSGANFACRLYLSFALNSMPQIERNQNKDLLNKESQNYLKIVTKNILDVPNVLSRDYVSNIM